MGTHKLIPMVIGNDGETPDDYEMARIKEGVCINCLEPFNEDKPLVYASTRQGILWWHKENCSRTKPITPNR